MRGYDQWKTASPHDDEEPNQTINEKLCDGTILIGYGKPGHGMNGKDADRGEIGQCCLKQLVTRDPVRSDSMKVEIHLHLYASVCEPHLEIGDEESDEEFEKRKEEVMDVAHSIVCNEPEYNGEWTGSDYWVFAMDTVLSIDLSVDQYDDIEDGSKLVLKAVADLINNRIFEGNDAMAEFECAMGNLNRSLDQLSKESEWKYEMES